jgi:uncharacterized repeat protein (TIGR02543 family)
VEVYKVQIMGFPIVSFDTHGGSAVAPVQMDSYNVPIQRPSDPVRSGYEFAGWFYDPELTDPVDWTAGITKPITMHAAWTAVQGPVVQHTVAFDTAGGSTVPSQTVQSGASASRPSDPVRPGYDFAGWYLGGSVYSFSSPVTRDIVITAAWTPVPEPTVYRSVSFDTAGGSVPMQSVRIADGSCITVPFYNGSKEGFEFAGWSLGGTPLQPGQSVRIVSDTILTAIWRITAPITFTVSFDTDGGEPGIDSSTVTSGSSFALPAYPGQKEGFEFAGWAVGTELLRPGDPVIVSEDITVMAVWTEVHVPSVFTVSFDAAGGSAAVPDMEVPGGSSFTFPAYTGTKEGCVFGGWAVGLKVYQPGESETIAGDVTARAIWDAPADDGEEDGDALAGFLDGNRTALIALAALVLVILLAVLIRRRR